MLGLFVVLAVLHAVVGAGVNQVHLALDGAPNAVVVTWSTPTPADTEVMYGTSSTFPNRARHVGGTQEKFVDNGTLHHTQYIHRATLDGLEELVRYSYRIHNGSDWSTTFSFLAPGGPEWTPVFTVYGDFGLINNVALPSLIYETQHDVSDVIVHVGDFAYDLYADNATFGDTWFNSVEPVYANIPVMVCPGNHEGMYNFLNYRKRFSMPDRGISDNLFHSWDAGLAHWIAYDTEVYFVYNASFGHGGIHRNFGPYPEIAAAQLKYIEADLIRATAQRAARPWIFAYGHRPMYCSDDDDLDCVLMRDQWRTDLENLFYRYGVDLIFEGHQHSYERLWPTYNLTVMNSTTPGQPYVNPLAPVHIVAGAAGCQEHLSTFGPPRGPWSALRVSEYGYGHLTVVNHTHVHWEQLHALNRTVLDSIWLVRDTHGSYN